MTDQLGEKRSPNKCSHCGNRGPYTIIRQPDCLEARCTRCGCGYDIGWDTRGWIATPVTRMTDSLGEKRSNPPCSTLGLPT